MLATREGDLAARVHYERHKYKSHQCRFSSVFRASKTCVTSSGTSWISETARPPATSGSDIPSNTLQSNKIKHKIQANEKGKHALPTPPGEIPPPKPGDDGLLVAHKRPEREKLHHGTLGMRIAVLSERHERAHQEVGAVDTQNNLCGLVR